jgi:hypothetical protein
MSSMNSAENLNFKVVIPGDDRKTCNFKILTLDKIVKWINDQSLDQTVKEELIKKAKTYPNSSLSSFRKNFSKHLSRAQKIARDKTPLYTKELGDDDEPESNSHSSLSDGARFSQKISESPCTDHFG